MNKKFSIFFTLASSMNRTALEKTGQEKYPVLVRIMVDRKQISFKSNFMLYSLGVPPKKRPHPLEWDVSPESWPIWSQSVDQDLFKLQNMETVPHILFTKDEFKKIKAHKTRLQSSRNLIYLIDDLRVLGQEGNAPSQKEKLNGEEIVAAALIKEQLFLTDVVNFAMRKGIDLFDLGYTSFRFMYYRIDQVLSYYLIGSLYNLLEKSKEHRALIHVIDWRRSAVDIFACLEPSLNKGALEILDSFQYVREFTEELKTYSENKVPRTCFYWLQDPETFLGEFEKYLIRKAQNDPSVKDRADRLITYAPIKKELLAKALIFFFTGTNEGGFEAQAVHRQLVAGVEKVLQTAIKA